MDKAAKVQSSPQEVQILLVYTWMDGGIAFLVMKGI